MTQQHLDLGSDFDFSPGSESAREGNAAKARWDLLGPVRELFDAPVPRAIDYTPVKAVNYLRAGVGLEERVTGGPYIVLDPVWIVNRLQFGAVSLFSWTTKMSAPSFSLPAGPIAQGGSCAAAEIRSPDSKKNSVHICDRCYAGKGSYLMYTRVALGQTIRLAWVNAMLRIGISRLASAFIEAIESLQDDSTITALATKNISVRHVRIHDSGDFHRPDYYLAWREAAYALPGISFWAPTRQWVFEKWRRLFQNYPPPSNMTLRPSALLFGEAAPRIDGLAAGSTSATIQAPWDKIQGVRTWSCPAYQSDGRSCASAGCRTCWEKSDVPVSYHPH